LSTGFSLPLISLSNTDARTQNGTEVIGEAQYNLPMLDGVALTGLGINLGPIVVDDPDGPSGPRAFTLGGADAASFAVRTVAGAPSLFFVGGGPLSFTNYEIKPSYHVTVNVADGTGGSAINLTLNITDVNDNAPVITSGDHVNVQEQTPTDVVVYRIQAADLDSTGEAFTYSLGGVDAADFSLDPNGEIRFNSVPDFDTPADTGGDNIYDITVGVSDGDNPTTTKAVTVRVTNTGNPPNFTTTPATPILWAENIAAAFVLYDANAIDPDAATVTYGLSGDDAGAFTIDPVTGELRFAAAPDFEKPLDVGGDNTYEVVVGAYDGFYTTNQNVTVDVTNVVGNTINLTAGIDEMIRNDPLLSIEEDTVSGLDSGDRLFGWFGNDTLIGGLGADKLYGDAGDDHLLGDEGNDFLVGEAGDDLLEGGLDNDKLIGGADDDTLLGGDGSDQLIAANGFDAEGVDTLDGGAGNDFLFADPGDIVQGGADYDILTARGNAGMNLVLAGTGIEEARGGDFNDVFDASGVTGYFVRLRGEVGNDTLIGGDDADKMFGGEHNDLLQGDAGNDFLVGDAGNDTLEGGLNNDTMLGGAGTDILVGGDGNDQMTGGAGFDTLTGGLGLDRFFSTDFDGLTDLVLDYSFADGDLVQGVSFEVVAGNTIVRDAGLNDVFQLSGYDADASGINLFA
jgi:Ca2+-binding RTX toxin-like protein